VEFDAPPIETANKVVGTRARLVRRIDGWDEEQARIFRLVCVCQTCQHAVAELRVADLDAVAYELEIAASALYGRRTEEPPSTRGEQEARDELADPRWAVEAQAVRAALGTALRAAEASRHARRLCQYAEDACDYASSGETAAVAFIAVHAHDSRTRVDVSDPFTAERQWQAKWLAKRLGIPYPLGSPSSV
jgi:hypothetical protein